MLKINRHKLILDYLSRNESASVAELCEAIGASEATIRRDLSEIEEQGRLIKVHGGALIPDFTQDDQDPKLREISHPKEKRQIAEKAARLIQPKDLVYLDAGTTTGALAEQNLPADAIYVTNDITIAERLMEKGLVVHVIGGRLKRSTRAIVGEECIENLNKYRFNVGFFGTNAYDPTEGYSTPDIGEASCKHCAIARCEKAYVLADRSKANKQSKVVFANFDAAELITD